MRSTLVVKIVLSIIGNRLMEKTERIHEYNKGYLYHDVVR